MEFRKSRSLKIEPFIRYPYFSLQDGARLTKTSNDKFSRKIIDIDKLDKIGTVETTINEIIDLFGDPDCLYADGNDIVDEEYLEKLDSRFCDEEKTDFEAYWMFLGEVSKNVIILFISSYFGNLSKSRRVRIFSNKKDTDCEKFKSWFSFIKKYRVARRKIEDSKLDKAIPLFSKREWSAIEDYL